jgi:hypothetical protein
MKKRRNFYMDNIKIYSNKVIIFNREVLENASYVIENGILKVFGDLIISDFIDSEWFDKDLLEKVREYSIRESWPLKRKHVFGWFDYKETEYATFRTNTFSIREYNKDY